MANQCSQCGGGIDKGYTAPEARCKCFEKDQKKIENAKHEMLVWESRWLVACGWQPVDILDAKTKGFLWKDEKGQSPITHVVAIETQRRRDENPLAQEQFNLEVRHQIVATRRERKARGGQDYSAEDSELRTIIKLMERTQAPRTGPHAVSPPTA